MGVFKKEDDPEMDLEKGVRTTGKGVGGHGGLCLIAPCCLKEGRSEKGWGGSIMKDQGSLEHWPGRGGHICFALEN